MDVTKEIDRDELQSRAAAALVELKSHVDATADKHGADGLLLALRMIEAAVMDAKNTGSKAQAAGIELASTIEPRDLFRAIDTRVAASNESVLNPKLGAQVEEVKRQATEFYRRTHSRLFKLAERVDVHPVAVALALRMMIAHLDTIELDEKYISTALLAAIKDIEPFELLVTGPLAMKARL